MELRSVIKKKKKTIAALLTAAIAINMLPNGLFSMLGGLFGTTANAEDDLLTEYIHGTAPAYAGEDDLYKGESAISALPDEVTYHSSYSSGNYMTVTEFRQKTHGDNTFNAANADLTGKRLMIGTPTDLYYLSLGQTRKFRQKKNFIFKVIMFSVPILNGLPCPLTCPSSPLAQKAMIPTTCRLSVPSTVRALRSGI